MRKEQISAKIAAVKAELMQIGAMRPGTLSQQYSACQKPGCKCVDPIQPQKHGPFYKLSYSHQGKSTTQFVRPQFVPEVKQQRRDLQEIQSTHAALGRTFSGVMQTGNARSSLGGLQTDAHPAVFVIT